MTQTMTNTDVVRRGYQAFNEADGATLTRLFDERLQQDFGLGRGHGARV